jgi:hypothetical protein
MSRRPLVTLRNASISSSTDWRPEGLSRESIQIRPVEVDLIEEVTIERPDHPIGLRMSLFGSFAADDHFMRSIRRGDKTIQTVEMLKRFQTQPDRGNPV